MVAHDGCGGSTTANGPVLAHLEAEQDDQSTQERGTAASNIQLGRIAYFFPMPPERSGISDYSAELLEPLTQLLGIDVFTNVDGATSRAAVDLYPYRAYPTCMRRTPYRLNVYAMGNNFEYHEEIFDLALRQPGLVVMHDLSLYDFCRIGFGARHAQFADEIEYAHGAPAREQWLRDMDRPERVDRIAINMLRRLAQGSRALVSHSNWGCEVLRDIAPGVPVFHIPLGATLGETSNNTARRAALGIPHDAFVAGVFGHLEPVKRVVQIVQAFADVVKVAPGAMLLVAGRSPNVGYLQSIKDAVRTTKLTKSVIFLGEPSLPDFEEYMRACNVVVNLRWPTSGETSASMTRAFGLGRPAITTDLPAFRDYSDEFCWRVPHVEPAEHEMLVQLLTEAAQNPERWRDAGLAAQSYVRECAQWSVVARRYADVISEVASEPTVMHHRGTLVRNPLRTVSGVNCIGDITAEVGLGTAAREMVRTILNEGIPASFIEREFPSPARDARASILVQGLPRTPKYPTNVLLYNINDMHLLSDEELARLTEGKYTIARWFWELSQLSDEWIKRIDRVDEIWVSSKFTQACFEAVTTKPVAVIPVTVEVPISGGAVRTNFGLPDDRFIYVFTFAATSTEARKNPFAVVDAFEKAFGRPRGKGAPFLVIKAHYVDEYPELKRDLGRAVERVGGMLVTQNYTRQETNDLLACTDCYVSLHRAEGFALGPAEAMYLGKPVIATNYSGNVDFMTDENSYLVSYREREIIARDHAYNPYGHLVYQPGMKWAEPDVAHAAELMRRVFDDPDDRTRKGERAASDIRALFSQEAVGHVIRSRLAEIERDQPAPTKNLGAAAAGAAATAVSPQALDVSLQLHQNAIGSLEWSRTRDKVVPFQKVKGIGTALRILARVLVQGRINERQQWINTAAYGEIRTLVDEVAAIKRQLQASSEVQPAVAEEVQRSLLRLEENQKALVAFLLKYGSAIGALEERVPELLRYAATSLSYGAGGQIGMLVDSLERPNADVPYTAGNGNQPLHDAQGVGKAWYHVADASENGDRAEFFKRIGEQLGQHDVFVLLTPADISVPFDVQPLQAIYDGHVPGGLRGTVVRHPRVARRMLALEYDFYYDADDPGEMTTEVSASGTWDPALADWLRRHLKAGSVVVDIGAGVGYFSTLAARIVGPSGKVIAVEPDPVSVEVLEMNKGLLPSPDTLQIVSAAVGELNGWTRLYRSMSDHTDHRTFALSAQNQSNGDKRHGIGIAVPMRRADGILEDIHHVDVVMVDTRGSDLVALRSMEAILQRDRPLVICRYSSSKAGDSTRDRAELRELLLGLGYRFELLRTSNKAGASVDMADATGATMQCAAAPNGPRAPSNLSQPRMLRPQPSGRKKALATIGSGPLAEVLDLTLPTFESYAQRHGYQLVVGDGDARGRPPAWGKVLLLRRLLDEYDEVFWVDADAVILDESVDLAAVLEPESYQAVARIRTIEGEVPNTGVWFLRGEKARQLLDAVWQCELFVDHKWWENAALTDLLGYSVAVPVRPLHTSPWTAGTHWLDPEWNSIPPWIPVENTRIRHYAGMTIEERVRGIIRDLRNGGLSHRMAAYPMQSAGVRT